MDESDSKPLHELVVTAMFRVENVVSKSYATEFIPHSEMVFGGPCSSYSGGLESELILKVSSDDKEIITDTLLFHGFSVVTKGNLISAKIPKYESKNVLSSPTHLGIGGVGSGFHSNYLPKVYSDRPFKNQELTIEIKILSEDGTILRTDRAANYKKFLGD